MNATHTITYNGQLLSLFVDTTNAFNGRATAHIGSRTAGSTPLAGGESFTNVATLNLDTNEVYATVRRAGGQYEDLTLPAMPAE